MSSYYNYYDEDKFNFEETLEPHKPPKGLEVEFLFAGIMFILVLIWNLRICWKNFCKKEQTGMKLTKYRFMSTVFCILRSVAKVGQVRIQGGVLVVRKLPFLGNFFSLIGFLRKSNKPPLNFPFYTKIFKKPSLEKFLNTPLGWGIRGSGPPILKQILHKKLKLKIIFLKKFFVSFENVRDMDVAKGGLWVPGNPPPRGISRRVGTPSKKNFSRALPAVQFWRGSRPS